MNENISQEKDEEIVRLVQKGETNLFGILIERYEKKMRNYARKFLSDKEDINDVLQEIFIKAYRNIMSFDAERRFSPWLYRIAHNEFINVLKKKNKKTIPLLDSDIFFPQHISAKDDLNQQIDQKEIKETIDKFLDKLEPKYKEPIILYYFEDLSYKEIADVMHIPIATVGIRIKRAKDMMKAISKELKCDLYPIL